jgi:integrase
MQKKSNRLKRVFVDMHMKKANPVWQVILGLSRYGGLRTPSETLSLRWDDIDWKLNRMSISEPKVEHHEGGGIRGCAIFPGLRPILDETFEIFGECSGSLRGPHSWILEKSKTIRSQHRDGLEECQPTN